MLAPPPVTHPSFYVIAVSFFFSEFVARCCASLRVLVVLFLLDARAFVLDRPRGLPKAVSRERPPSKLPRRPQDFARLSQALREVVVQGWPQDVTQTFQGFISIPIARECPRDLGNISQALCSSILGNPPKAISQDWPQEFG